MNIKERSPSEHGGNRKKAKSRSAILWEFFYQFLHWIEFNELLTTEIFLMGERVIEFQLLVYSTVQYPNTWVPITWCSWCQHGAATARLKPEWPCNVIPVSKIFILLGVHYLYRSLLWIIGQYTYLKLRENGWSCVLCTSLLINSPVHLRDKCDKVKYAETSRRKCFDAPRGITYLEGAQFKRKLSWNTVLVFSVG